MTATSLGVAAGCSEAEGMKYQRRAFVPFENENQDSKRDDQL
jgi:hypothetical protein